MTPGPGWYHDEHGTVRWFDGDRWTHHVRDGAATGEAAPASPGSAAPRPGTAARGPDETPQDLARRRAPWLLAGVAVVLVVALAAAVVVVTGGPDGAPTAGPDRTDAASSPTEDPSQDTSPDTEDTEDPEDPATDAAAVEGVAEQFMTAALDVDCVRVEELITPRMREDGDECGAGVSAGDLGGATFENAPAEIDGDDAVVRSAVSDLAGDGSVVEFVMELELTDAGWLVDDFRTV